MKKIFRGDYCACCEQKMDEDDKASAPLCFRCDTMIDIADGNLLYFINVLKYLSDRLD